MFLRKKNNCGAEDGARRSQTYFFQPKLSSRKGAWREKKIRAGMWQVFINL
jgi:hypothetical protein